MTSTKRIFLVHATPVAIAPVNDAFANLWPEAELCNLLEDSLSRDLHAAGQLTEPLKRRFCELARYAQGAGADAVLFTCSAFGEAIELCRTQLEIPVLKPNEAMIQEALGRGRRIGILATFEPTVASMTKEFIEAAAARGTDISIVAHSCPEAMLRLRQGDVRQHDRLVAEMAALIEPCDVLCFAQFSMTSAALQAAEASGMPVLTTPESAVALIRKLLEGQD